MDWKKIGSAALSNNIVLLVFIGLLAIAYLRFAPDSLKPWTNAPQPAQQAQESRVVERIERVLIPGPERIRTIEKIKYIEKLPGALTPATMADNTAHVVASAKIPPSPAGGTASAILRNVDGVGVGSIEYKPATPPFFAVQKEFGVRAGMGTGGLVLGEIYARPLRVGPVTVEVRGYGKRDDRSGADFGGAAIVDYRF
jgi:hypothetical protein